MLGSRSFRPLDEREADQSGAATATSTSTSTSVEGGAHDAVPVHMESDGEPAAASAPAAAAAEAGAASFELEEQPQDKPINRSPSGAVSSSCHLTRRCVLIVGVVIVILALIIGIAVGVSSNQKSNTAEITKPGDGDPNGGSHGVNGSSSSTGAWGPSSSTGGSSTPPPTPTPTPTGPTSPPTGTGTGQPTLLPLWTPPPARPNDRCNQAFPQSLVSPWMSTSTCDACTSAGCGWCTFPVLHVDGTTRYYSSCRERSVADAHWDVDSVCRPTTIPDTYKKFPTGKSLVFATYNSTDTAKAAQGNFIQCNNTALAEHPSTPLYPPSDDMCHNNNNSRSCTACVDFPGGVYNLDNSTTGTNTTCGWLTLPVQIDGVTRWYGSCRTIGKQSTEQAKRTNVHLPLGKTKVWAQYSIGVPLSITTVAGASCRDPALANGPYTPAPYLVSSEDDSICASESTCSGCTTHFACGWCITPVIAADGSVTTQSSCRAGYVPASNDGTCLPIDPRVPAAWWGYNLAQTWSWTSCDATLQNIIQTTAPNDYLDRATKWATNDYYAYRSSGIGCSSFNTSIDCAKHGYCGWCTAGFGVGTCVPSYFSYDTPPSAFDSNTNAKAYTGTMTPYSPLCTAPNTSLLVDQHIPWYPKKPLASDLCQLKFPQDSTNPWVSTATCDQCTLAGCGWCTIPVKQPDGGLRYYTQCMQTDSEAAFQCTLSNVPLDFQMAIPAGKTQLFAYYPSGFGPFSSCSAPELAEHPDTPLYPPVTDSCHTQDNQQSCTACVDWPNSSYNTAGNSSCGWLSLLVNVDGVARYYTSCRTIGTPETNAALAVDHIIVSGKPKIWATYPVSQPLSLTTSPNMASCRDPQLSDSPYTPGPYSSDFGLCSGFTTCFDCTSNGNCGWCSSPSIGADGSVTVESMCRSGFWEGSYDRQCLRVDPRVPATWWEYNLQATWSAIPAQCPTDPSQAIAQPTTPTDFLDRVPRLATASNFAYRSSGIGCSAFTTQTACVQHAYCGWCSSVSDGSGSGVCVSSYFSYDTPPRLSHTNQPFGGSLVPFSPLCAAPYAALIVNMTIPWKPSFNPPPDDRCAALFPQHPVNSWASTTTCDACTLAGCGWCTIPVRQADNSTRYYTSCREMNSDGTADANGDCSLGAVPPAYRRLPPGKTQVFAGLPSGATSDTQTTCGSPTLAEHPSVPAYPPSSDSCHTMSNQRSCTACVDFTNSAYTTTSTSTCGWLTLPVTVDGVKRWYTSCRNASLPETALARQTQVTLPTGKTKVWAQYPLGASLSSAAAASNTASCREPALADSPYYPGPAFSLSGSDCSTRTECETCTLGACGWCWTPQINPNGTITMIGSCRVGGFDGSTDGQCLKVDPRVPNSWWGYNLVQTWMWVQSDCPSAQTIAQAVTNTTFLDRAPKVALASNFAYRSSGIGCSNFTTSDACTNTPVCGWCSDSARGSCVPTYFTYDAPSADTSLTWPTGGTQVPFSPMCAAPNINLQIDTHIKWAPIPPAATDSCQAAFPQDPNRPWASTATCDQCTLAGCGWCTMPIVQDGTPHYFTSCREKSFDDQDKVGGCSVDAIPLQYRNLPQGKTQVWTVNPSGFVTQDVFDPQNTCRDPQLAEHPATPPYPPPNDDCHTVSNQRSCSACVDMPNGVYNTNTTSACGWLTLPVTVDGVKRYFTSCRNASLLETTQARQTQVTLSPGKTKNWAQYPVSAPLVSSPNTASCREVNTVLQDAPYIPRPVSVSDSCSSMSGSTCEECIHAVSGSTCGWCATPVIGANGQVTGVQYSCREGSTRGSNDGQCLRLDPRVPATWFEYNLHITWAKATFQCPNSTTQAMVPYYGPTDYLDRTPKFAIQSNYNYRSSGVGCSAFTDPTSCTNNGYCGWCLNGNGGGNCMPSYFTWAAPPNFINATRKPVVGSLEPFSPLCAAPATALQVNQNIPWKPSDPVEEDRCTIAFPQSSSRPWVSTATCDQCTRAGCGWCTIPVKEGDNVVYHTSCREKNSAGTADVAGECMVSAIPASHLAMNGKTAVFAALPSTSTSTTQTTCRSPTLAEHPSTPVYPFENDTCHNNANARSCSACVDYTNGVHTSGGTSSCGWLTLPVTVDGVKRWYTSCRTPNTPETQAAQQTQVQLPTGKTKVWAQYPVGAPLSSTAAASSTATCREPALAEGPYTPGPFLPSSDSELRCSNYVSCGTCSLAPACGWATIPVVSSSGVVTVMGACRGGSTLGSTDGQATVIDPRVPATWWEYNLQKTWAWVSSDCPESQPITQPTTPTTYLDRSQKAPTLSNYLYRSSGIGCSSFTSCTACAANAYCGWCSSGSCVPSYYSYRTSSSQYSQDTSRPTTGTMVPFSPLCAAPATYLKTNQTQC